jgi:hypothetical protein
MVKAPRIKSDMKSRRPVNKRKPFLFVVLLAWMTVGAAPDKTVYTNTSNKELKMKAAQLVKQIRSLVYSYNKKDRELMAAYDNKNRPEIRIDERKGMRQQWLRDSDAAHDSFMRDYKDKYWAEAILLRNELYRRLPKKLQQSQLGGIYQHPTNILGVEVIADNLELLSKSLPDS